MTTYTYDGVGNRLTMNGISYTYDAGDRLLQAGATTYGYDANGNMVSKTEAGETTNYSYDYANRLISIQNPQSKIQNSYDGYGRRISRLAKSGGLGIPEAQSMEYLWDGTNVLCEFYQNKGNPLEYVYGNGQMISRDDLLVLPVSKRLVYQNSHWFHPDGLGSVVNLTDSAGNTKLTYAYDAFGEITKEEGQVGWKKNRYTFTGKPYDPASGMYYFGARWYEPEIGRFITSDPLTWGPDDTRIIRNPSNNRIFQPFIERKVINTAQKYPQFFHDYVYCFNNPINYTDPAGESPAVIIVVGGSVFLLIGGWILGPVEIQIGNNPLGQEAATFGPWVTLYGPSFRAEHPEVQEAIRYHERVHAKNFWLSPQQSEILAYTKQKEYVMNRLKDPTLDPDTRRELEYLLDGIDGMLKYYK